jgi:hypothetical protein
MRQAKFLARQEPRPPNLSIEVGGYEKRSLLMLFNCRRGRAPTLPLFGSAEALPSRKLPLTSR